MDWKEWLFSTRFPLAPEVPWWGLFLLGCLSYLAIRLLLFAVRRVKRPAGPLDKEVQGGRGSELHAR